MGETSYKSMRGAAMDDVIFSGTNGRPARNMAEVTIFVDNTDRLAPAEFNDSDQIDISRRIEREAGSAYRINGSEVRARDVKILFEDAATGARSPALVRQGQIGEIVNAKPEQRRRILEDAAGTAGLHSRRHEAELRLRGAETNLERIGDVIGQLKSQIDSLKRQARQARRYSELSDEIRKCEALQAFLTWSAQQAQVDHDEAALQVALEGLGAATVKEAEATKLEAEFAEALQPLRNEEVTRAAVLARLQHAQNNLDNELRRAHLRKDELEARAGQLDSDIARERGLVEESQLQSERLRQEQAALIAERGADENVEGELKSDLSAAETELSEHEKVLAGLVGQQSEARAQRLGAETQLRERTAQVARLEAQDQQLGGQIAQTMTAAPDAEKLSSSQAEVEALSGRLIQLDEDAAAAERTVASARQSAQLAQTEREKAQLHLRQVETERQTLANLFLASSDDAPPIVDQIDVAKGYEVALGAALGDDLELPIGIEGAVHWRRWDELTGDGTPADAELPDGVLSLALHVSGPPELQRCLLQIGVVDAAEGADLQLCLRPGQRLVSRDGDLWRWDGIVAPADVPTPAAQRLAARNRLRELTEQEIVAKSALESAETAATAAEESAKGAQQSEQALRQQRREDQARLTSVGQSLAVLERAARESEARLATLNEAKASCATQLVEGHQLLEECTAAIDALPAVNHLDDDVSAARTHAMASRDRVADLKAQITAIARERQRRLEQSEKLGKDIARWGERAAEGARQVESLGTRLTETRSELDTVKAFPQEVESRRQRLLNELAEADAGRKAAADKLAEAETAGKEASTVLRETQAAVSEQREIRARADARLEAARGRRAEIVKTIEEKFEATPEGALAIAEVDGEGALPDLGDTDSRLQRLRTGP